jgi:hypothetical protein
MRYVLRRNGKIDSVGEESKESLQRYAQLELRHWFMGGCRCGETMPVFTLETWDGVRQLKTERIEYQRA